MISRGVSPHPLMAGVVIGTRLALTRLPDPEIYVAAGTELIVRVTGERPDAVIAGAAVPEPVATWLAGMPVKVTMPDGTAAADIVNLAFGGTREEVEAAFAGAGWVTADALNARTFAKS